MAEQVKERKDIEQEYLWDLTSLFVDDDAWEAEFGRLSADLEKIASFRGKLGDGAAVVAEAYRTVYELGARLEAFHGYAFQRRTEDARLVDTTALSFEETVEEILRIVEGCQNG